MKYRWMSLGIELGANAVEERLTEIALLTRKTFPECRWTRQNGTPAEHINELRVIVNSREEPVRFTDRELISYSSRKRRTVIDHRMQAVLKRLLDA